MCEASLSQGDARGLDVPPISQLLGGKVVLLVVRGEASEGQI